MFSYPIPIYYMSHLMLFHPLFHRVPIIFLAFNFIYRSFFLPSSPFLFFLIPFILTSSSNLFPPFLKILIPFFLKTLFTPFCACLCLSSHNISFLLSMVFLIPFTLFFSSLLPYTFFFSCTHSSSFSLPSMVSLSILFSILQIMFFFSSLIYVT